MPGSLGDKILHFYKTLTPPTQLPSGIAILFPQKDPEVMRVVGKFLCKFYTDNNPRRLIFGINPGRFGAGTTGINFTAPRQLKEYCGIDHSFRNSQSELSAEFIYQLIAAYGGAEKFYSRYFITSVSPLGFTRKGINLNYYDDNELLKIITPFIVESIKEQLSFGFLQDRCYCIGGDKNLKWLSKLNNDNHFFKEIIPLPHPRFIMQYRRKHVRSYIKEYLQVLK
jgi:hypothetical protein